MGQEEESRFERKTDRFLTRRFSFAELLSPSAKPLGSDLAYLYGVKTRALKEAVRRYPDRFPVDLMFELTKGKWGELKESLRSQNVTLEESQRESTVSIRPMLLPNKG